MQARAPIAAARGIGGAQAGNQVLRYSASCEGSIPGDTHAYTASRQIIKDYTASDGCVGRICCIESRRYIPFWAPSGPEICIAEAALHCQVRALLTTKLVHANCTGGPASAGAPGLPLEDQPMPLNPFAAAWTPGRSAQLPSLRIHESASRVKGLGQALEADGGPMNTLQALEDALPPMSAAEPAMDSVGEEEDLEFADGFDNGSLPSTPSSVRSLCRMC